MTRVVRLTVDRVRLRFRTPVRYGGVERTWQEVGILRLQTDSGHSGLGEVAGPVLPDDLDRLVTETEQQVVGRSPQDIAAPEAGMLGGAVDSAVLDLLGQIQGEPVRSLIGGVATSVPVNGLLVLNAGAPDAAAASALALVQRGFRTLKLKRMIGGRSVDASLSAVRAAVGPGIALRLDLNGDLDERTAIEWLATLGQLHLEYVEQPIAPSLGARALARVRRAIPMPLAGDESVVDDTSAMMLLDAHACDVLVVKPSRVGGPRAAMTIARRAADAGVAVTISTMYESGVGLAAALHVAAAVNGDRAHGLATGELLVDDLVGRRLPVVDGRMDVPDAPGLGVTLDHGVAAGHSVLA